MNTIAACDVCGRGYVTLAREGVECIARDLGRVWLLPEPEDNMDDDDRTRLRRKRLVAPKAVPGPPGAPSAPADPLSGNTPHKHLGEHPTGQAGGGEVDLGGDPNSR